MQSSLRSQTAHRRLLRPPLPSWVPSAASLLPSFLSVKWGTAMWKTQVPSAKALEEHVTQAQQGEEGSLGRSFSLLIDT